MGRQKAMTRRRTAGRMERGECPRTKLGASLRSGEREVKRAEGVGLMEIGDLARDGIGGMVLAGTGRSVNGVGIRGLESRREVGHGKAGLAGPAVLFVVDAGGEFDGEGRGNALTDAMQEEDEIVAVGAEFDFEIAVVHAEKKKLDDLVFPQMIGRSGSSGRSRIMVKGGVELDEEHPGVHVEVECRVIAGCQRMAVPGLIDCKSHRGLAGS